MALAGRPARRELQNLDQNLCRLLSEKGTYSPDAVQHVPTGTCCCSNVGGKGELTVECHTEVPSSQGKHGVVEAYCISLNTIAVSLICIWTGAMFWSVAPLLGWGSFTDRGYGTCEVDWSKANYSTIHKSYIISILVFCFFIPVMIMLFSYTSIINTVKSTNAMSADGFLTSRQRKVERDVTRISIVICTAFIMAWSPYAVVSMWSAWGFQVPSTTSIITRLFAKSASFYNPLIYFGMSSKFRNDVAVLLPCTRERKEVVHLQHFKHIKPKAETPLPPASLPVQKPEAKYVASNPDTDSGVNSPPQTPPTDPQGVFHIDLPSHIETSEYWCDRF